MPAIEVDSIKSSPIQYSICTLMSNPVEYQEMLVSFQNAGFSETFCEFLYIDNSIKNKYDAYSGIRKFLTIAQGKYIILCHQDILLNHDTIQKLSACIEELNQKDKNWGILGNAGGIDIKKNVYRIAYPDGTIINDVPFPHKVNTLDENFLLLKKEACLSISSDLSGFHLYGTDLCLIAKVLGYNSYVIDFLLTHKSYGNPDKSFYALKDQFISKYRRAFNGTYIRTTITIIFISGCRFKSQLGNTKAATKVVKFLTKAKKALNIS